MAPWDVNRCILLWKEKPTLNKKTFQNLVISMFHRFLLCVQVCISEMSPPQATHSLRILGYNKAVSFSHKNVWEKRKIRKKDMLVVTASAAFTATAGFSGSFTEPETGKSASSTPNQGLFYLFFLRRRRRRGKRRKRGRRRRRKKKGKDAIYVFLARQLLFLRLRINRNTRPALKNCSFSSFVRQLGEDAETKFSSFSSWEHVFAYTEQRPFLSSLYEKSDLTVCCFRREAHHHCHQWSKDKMKYKDAQFSLLSSNQWDCSLRILTEADVAPSLSGSHFKQVTSPTHRGCGYSAMIQFAERYTSYTDMNVIRPTVCPRVRDITSINVYKKQNSDIL